MRVTLLGTGTSTGIPVIGCTCQVCLSDKPKNQRTRSSIAIQNQDDTIIVDTGPEFRLQMTRSHIRSVTAVLYTHLHADHCHGFDDLRALYFHSHQAVPCYVATEFIEEFKSRFSYVFRETGYQGTKPQIDLRPMPEKLFHIGSIPVEPVRLPHGAIETFGFKFNNFAYITDFKQVPEPTKTRWRDKVEYMVASGIHFGTHPTHSVIPETIKLFQELNLKKAYITHISHEIDHDNDRSRLPDAIEFGYDGLSFEV